MISSIQAHRPLDGLTTFGTRSEADHYAEAGSLDELEAHLAEANANGLPVHFLGAGANTIAMSRVPGMTIRITIKGVEMSAAPNGDVLVKCGAGEVFDDIVARTLKAGIGGLENLSAIPGTVGGAVRMNAGTRREFLGPRIVSVTTLRPGEGLRRYAARDIEWNYRETSIPFDEVVLECEVATTEGSEQEIRRAMQKSQERRRITQPLGLPSCGSVFRNPEGESVGRLIENVGLKGALCGGAQISERHANFIVNKGGAKAVEVLSLIHAASDAVAERYGVELVPEVRFLGFE